MAELAVYDSDPTLYLFTSLTAGSSHIVTATSRIETILKANKIPFKGVDTATDDLARKLYGRRASGKKLPLLVKQGYVVGVSSKLFQSHSRACIELSFHIFTIIMDIQLTQRFKPPGP